MAIWFGLQRLWPVEVEPWSRNGPKALAGVQIGMRSLGTSLNETSLTPLNGPKGRQFLGVSVVGGIFSLFATLDH